MREMHFTRSNYACKRKTDSRTKIKSIAQKFETENRYNLSIMIRFVVPIILKRLIGARIHLKEHKIKTQNHEDTCSIEKTQHLYKEKYAIYNDKENMPQTINLIVIILHLPC